MPAASAQVPERLPDPDGRIYAGYGEKPPSREKGTTPEPINRYAGKQCDTDTRNAFVMAAIAFGGQDLGGRGLTVAEA